MQAKKIDVRFVKFSPEEMAYDAPPDTSDPKRFVTIGRGPVAWKEFVNFRNGFVRIDPKIRSAFPTEKAVNLALRKLIETHTAPPRKRKSA
jgi:hypothetical protein